MGLDDAARSMSHWSSSCMQVILENFSQELQVLAFFVFSYWVVRAWRQHVRGTKRRGTKVLPPEPPTLAKSNAELRLRPGAPCGPRVGAADLAGDLAPASQIRAWEAQMLQHLEHREFTRALNMYRGLERDGRDRGFSEELYLSFVQSAVRVEKIDVVERMLRVMRRHRMEPSLRFWQTTMKMLASRKHFSACLVVHTLFSKQIPTDKVVFSCLINAALEVGDPQRAALMLERYRDAGIEAKDHVLFFRTYVALGDVDSAEAVFQRLGADASTLMLNLLLLTCVNADQPARGIRLLREAHDFESQGVQDIPSEKIVDVVSYNTIIKGFAQAKNSGQCFECLQEMVSHGIDPDDITYGTLLDSCIADNHIDAAGEIVNLLMGSSRPMDTVMCTLFIKGFVRANCLPKALELCEEMKRRKSAHPDIITYSVLIKALVDQHDLDRALGLVEDMKMGGLQPDDIILTHLLEGCRYAGNHDLGQKLFRDMLASGVKPSEFSLVTMLKLHGRCGAHEAAHELVASWEEQHEGRPSVIHYTCLMSGCMRTKSYDQAWKAYELMKSKGIKPDSMALSTLLPGMVAAQRWDRVLELVRLATARGQSAVPSETLNNALFQVEAAGGHRGIAEELRALMAGAGVAVSARHASRVLRAAPRFGGAAAMRRASGADGGGRA